MDTFGLRAFPAGAEVGPPTGGVAVVPPTAAARAFGAVLAEEDEIQRTTREFRAAGPRADTLDSILDDQDTRLRANIALLEQRYERLPRVEERSEVSSSQVPNISGSPQDRLPRLVAQHLKVLGDITTLLAHRSDGLRGEMILTEVARNHEEMVSNLTTLFEVKEARRGSSPVPTAASFAANTTEEDWENEGGPVRREQIPAALS